MIWRPIGFCEFLETIFARTRFDKRYLDNSSLGKHCNNYIVTIIHNNITIIVDGLPGRRRCIFNDVGGSGYTRQRRRDGPVTRNTSEGRSASGKKNVFVERFDGRGPVRVRDFRARWRPDGRTKKYGLFYFV
jgi:hypothetical protein